MDCRGLIVGGRTGEVVARGMPKFFNHNHEQAPEFGMENKVHVADKKDGSLGIIYPTPLGEWAVTTRGDFAREVQRSIPDELKAQMFMLFDGKDIVPLLWEKAKPTGNKTPVRHNREENE